jgi:hypothetical protein
MFYKGREVKIYSETANFYFLAFADELDNTFNVKKELVKDSIKKSLSPLRLIQESSYAAYEGHKDVFDAPLDFEKNGDLWEFLDTHSVKHGQLIIGCGPETRERVLDDLVGCGISNPEGYVRIYEKGHDVKFDLFIPDPKMPGIDLQLGVFLNPHRLNSTGLYQIGRREYITRLLTQVHILEIQESLSPYNLSEE